MQSYIDIFYLKSELAYFGKYYYFCLNQIYKFIFLNLLFDYFFQITYYSFFLICFLKFFFGLTILCVLVYHLFYCWIYYFSMSDYSTYYLTYNDLFVTIYMEQYFIQLFSFFLLTYFYPIFLKISWSIFFWLDVWKMYFYDLYYYLCFFFVFWKKIF